jgi:hypothetical protein
MPYTYYFRSRPDLTAPMPDGMSKLRFLREPEFDLRFHCAVYGSVVFSRPLSTEEQNEHDLIPDPRNHLAGVMLE